jgi:hypothetical protein
MMRIGTLLGAVLLATAPAAAQSEPEMPGWMAGCWEVRDGERWTEECWTAPRGGIMLGSGRNGVGTQLRSWEAMQIELNPEAGDGAQPKMGFWGAPFGQGRTLFVFQPDEGEGVTFFNVAHDYPQRIRYWRDGELLNAEVSLADGSQANRWTYRRMGSD